MEGLIEGKLEGKAALIQKLLNKRFDRTSPILKEKLQKANSEVLDKISEDILDPKNSKDAENWWKAQGQRRQRVKGSGAVRFLTPPSPTPATPRAGGW